MLKRNGFDFHVALLAVILASVFILIIPTIQDVLYRERHDEGYYFKYATYVSDKGLGGFKDLAGEYIDNKEHWIFPNPLRVGLISLSALWVKLLGKSFYSLSHLSFVSYLLLIAICYYYCRRLFDREKAILLALLTAFSPLNMAMSRRALSESVSMLLLCLSAWLFLDMMQKDRSALKKALFVFVFSYSILVKETNCLLAVPFVIYMAIHKFHFKKALQPADVLCVLVYPAVLAGSVYLIAFGSLFDVLRIVGIAASSAKINLFALKYGGGPWFRYIIDFMLLSPWIVIFSVGYIFYMMLNFSKASEGEVYFLVILLAMFSVFNLFAKNVRYVMIFDLPMRLFFILMLYKLVAIRSDRIRYAVITLIVSLICLTGFLTYNDFFINKGLYNPMTTWLLELRGIACWR